MHRLGIDVSRMTAEEEPQRCRQTVFSALGHVNQVCRGATLADFLTDRAHETFGGAGRGHGLGSRAFGRLARQHDDTTVGRDLTHDRMEEAIQMLEPIDARHVGRIEHQSIVLGAIGGLGSQRRTGRVQVSPDRLGNNAVGNGTDQDLQSSQRLVCVLLAATAQPDRRGQAHGFDDIAKCGLAGQPYALMFAFLLGASGLSMLAIVANLLTAWLTFASIIGYAVIYTLYLKRATPQNIVIGGIAGAAPPLLGWVAVTGSVDAHALLLVAIIFAWTPPHFWALCIAKKDEYAKADIPMLPVTHGDEYTRLHMLLYTILMVIVTVLPYLSGMSGVLYEGFH